MEAFPFDSELTFDEHDNPIYDRAVSSQPLRELIRGLFSTGVMPNPSTCLQVSAGTDGMTVQVAAGFAVVDGGLCKEKDTRTLEVTAADNTYDRIDTVVVRWNENVDVRTADLYVVAGTPAVNPVRPTLQRNNSVYEIGLADVFITKRVATITNDKITDTRYDSSRCGIVSSVSEWDTTTIYQQIQADLAGFKTNEQAGFESWFDTIRGILDSDTAGHLQNEINDLNENVAGITDNLTSDNGVPFKFGIDGNGDYGYYKQGEANLTPFKTRHTETYKPAVRANNLDMGLYHKKRYVDTTDVPNTNSDTYNVTSNGRKDMGETNTNRFVEVAVNQTPSHKSTSPTNYVGYNNGGTTKTGNSWSAVSIADPTGSSYAGACGIKIGNASVSKSGSTITITIPETIRCGNRFGLESTHSDYSRNIVVTLTI